MAKKHPSAFETYYHMDQLLMNNSVRLCWRSAQLALGSQYRLPYNQDEEELTQGIELDNQSLRSNNSSPKATKNIKFSSQKPEVKDVIILEQIKSNYVPPYP